MKITALSKREDYKSIIYNSLLKYLVDQSIDTNNIKMSKYYINKRLSIIFSDKISNDLFYKSVAEYSYNKNIFKRYFQFFYVKLVSLKYLRNIFSDDFIYLPTFFSSFSIIGGNHRIRLLNNTNSNFLVLLKNGESTQFIHNELKIRMLPKVNYLPSINHELNNNWFYESYESGIPFNRINFSKQKKNEYFNYLFHLHNTSLIIPTKKKIHIKDYIYTVKSDINNYIKKGKYATEMNPILYELFKEFDNYFSNSEMFVYTSYTHGDFQEGNLRIQDNRTIVIDWESSDKRFFLYDFYVLLGNPRHDKYLLNSYKTFKQQIRLLNDFPNEFINEKTMVLLFLEELKFYIYEENSVNYNTPPKRCKEIIIQLVSILSFLNFNKNKNNVKKCIYF